MNNGRPGNAPASNQPLLPPGWTIARNRWETEGVWRAYHHNRPMRDFKGRTARKDAVAFCWGEHRSREADPPDAPEDEDAALTAILRSHREDAGRRVG